MRNFQLSELLQGGIDWAFAQWPQQQPSDKLLSRCRVVGHRGYFDNLNIFENTLPAFQNCIDHGIWGVELDIRWTQDLHPVVLHDTDCGRVYGRPNIEPARYPLSLLRQRAPFIPTLQEVVDLCGFKVHLMIELKESLSDPDHQKVRHLSHILQRLRPEIDFHLMSFSNEQLKHIDFVPKKSLLGIAEWNLMEMSSQVLHSEYGGITGHYLLMNKNMIKTHQEAGQKVGVGFISSTNSLFREINRGVDWVFTNHPLSIQQCLKNSRTQVKKKMSSIEPDYLTSGELKHL